MSFFKNLAKLMIGIDPDCNAISGTVKLDGQAFEKSLEIIRPANTTQYTIGDIINNGIAVNCATTGPVTVNCATVGPSVVECATTNEVANIVPVSVVGLTVGMLVSGDGIQAGTVVDVVGEVNVGLSLPATATNAAVNLTFIDPVNGAIVTPAAMTGLVVAMTVSGAGMPEGATVTAIGETTVTISAPATATAAAEALTFVDLVGVVTITPTAMAGIVAGMPVTGAGIPVSTTVVSVGETTAVISNAATATAAAALLTFGALALPAFDLSDIAEATQQIRISSINVLSDNGTAGTKLTCVAHLYHSAAPQAIVADNTAWNPAYANRKTRKAQFNALVADANVGTAAYSYGQVADRQCQLIAGKLYLALIATNAYTPVAGEKIYVTITGILL